METESKKQKTFDPLDEKKRPSEDGETSTKRIKSEISTQDLHTLKRKNFVTACEQVSYKAFFDLRSRLQLVYLPPLLDENRCKHRSKASTNIIQMPPYTEELVNIEMKTNMWSEALEVCQLCIKPNQYLSASVLQSIVEIIMNAHEDAYADYTIEHLIDKCQEILSLNFSAHPPCMSKTLTTCYDTFLRGPLDLKENTFTNRRLFECNKGIVKYCMNRLEYELSLESVDEALIDKNENIPAEMQKSVKGLHWQKENFEIFELLTRPERIKRLMAVLQSLIELLQFDLANWLTRYTNNLDRHIMRSHKPLMAYILWSNNVLHTGAVNNNCRQILKLFIFLVHLQYPEQHIKIFSDWLNTIIQTCYICETNSEIDYPTMGTYSTTFAKEFYKLISEMPQVTITKVLERIQPTFMQSLIATLHLKTLLSTQECDILKIFMDFISKAEWQRFPQADTEIEVYSKSVKCRKTKNLCKYLSKLSNSVMESEDCLMVQVYPKIDPVLLQNDCTINQNDVLYTMYIALEAHLDAYNLQAIQEKLDNLNEELVNNKDKTVTCESQYSSYSFTENFIKKYRSIFQILQELMVKLIDMKKSGQLPNALKIFEKIGLLGL